MEIGELSTAPAPQPPITVAVTFLDGPSELQEVWDVVIDDRPARSIARFGVQVQPATPAIHSGEVVGPGGVVRSGLAVTANGSDPVSVEWDGRGNGGAVLPVGEYKIRLTATVGSRSASAESAPMKIVRVGVAAARFSGVNVYPLKFAFKKLPTTFDADDFPVPDWQWKLETLDRGPRPRPPPACLKGRGSDPNTYCYPIAAKRLSQLAPKLRLGGAGYAASDGIALEIVDAASARPWGERPVEQIEPGQVCEVTASEANKVPAYVRKVDPLQLDFVFTHTDSRGRKVTLGRQLGPRIVVYVLVSEPQAPWGRGTAADRQRPWVELLEKVCQQWATGARTVEDAAALVVRAVYERMLLTYDTDFGADVNGLVTKTPGFVPISIELRSFLRWLMNDPARPIEWNKVNCTCCGALVSTIANAAGCSIVSSVISKSPLPFAPGFRCNKIIGVGPGAGWHHPFSDPADTWGGFSYHEFAWTGAATDSDDVYDGCLKLANDPIAAPASNPVWATGMKFTTTNAAIDDYRRRLVFPADVAQTVPRTSMAGRYLPR